MKWNGFRTKRRYTIQRGCSDILPAAETLIPGSAEPQVSGKVCQGFRETKMRKGGRIFWGAVLNLCVRIKIRVATSDTDHSVADSTQTVHHWFNHEAARSFVQVSQHSWP